MDLFGNNIDEKVNLLPNDGTVNYFGKVFYTRGSQSLF